MNTDNPKNSAPRSSPISGEHAGSSAYSHQWQDHESRGDISARCPSQSARQAPRVRHAESRRIITSRGVERDNARDKGCIKQCLRLEASPPIRTAIEAASTVMLRGSLMSAAQRRDHVLDRLIVESERRRQRTSTLPRTPRQNGWPIHGQVGACHNGRSRCQAAHRCTAKEHHREGCRRCRSRSTRCRLPARCLEDV
jgi:hypothetical protein